MNSGNYEGWKLQTKVNVNGNRYDVNNTDKNGVANEDY